MAAFNRNVAMKPRQHLRIPELVTPVFLEFFQKDFLGIIMLGKRARGAGDFHWSEIRSRHGASAITLPDIVAYRIR